LPKPTTQIPVVDGRGRLVRVLDMGWEDFRVAAEYDGDQHRINRIQYVKDMRTQPKLARLGWIVIRVIKEDRDEDTIDRAYRAMISRGWDGKLRPTASLQLPGSAFAHLPGNYRLDAVPAYRPAANARSDST